MIQDVQDAKEDGEKKKENKRPANVFLDIYLTASLILRLAYFWQEHLRNSGESAGFAIACNEIPSYGTHVFH